MAAQDPPAPRLATESQKAGPLPSSTVGPKKKFPKLKITVPRRGRTSPNTTPPVTDPLITLASPPKEARPPLAYGVILTPSNEWIDPGLLKQKLEDNRKKRVEAMGRSPSTAAPPLGSPLTQFVRAHSATGSGAVTLNPLGGSATSLRSGDDPDTPLHTPLSNTPPCLDL